MLSPGFILSALVTLISALPPIPASGPAMRWVIMKGCSLKVDGSTNVNKFSCVIANYGKPDTLVLTANRGSEALKMTGSMALDVADFDCHNSMMTRDLRKTLKEKEFPKLIIRFVSLSKLPSGDASSGEKITGAVTIELAGVVKQFVITYQFSRENDQTITLLGSRSVNFSDFNIVPPRKIGGIIQTNNELLVGFNLKLKALDQ